MVAADIQMGMPSVLSQIFSSVNISLKFEVFLKQMNVFRDLGIWGFWWNGISNPTLHLHHRHRGQGGANWSQMILIVVGH